ncbi:MAG: DUF805 domain-containing protein [Rhodobacteraceae bacterium]|nr:DUF805 domain-containing protein [Paracoccaceae bacterium]
MMPFGQAVKTCLFEKYVTFSGRASRSEFWWFWLFCLILNVLLSLPAMASSDPAGWQVVHFICAVLLVLPSLAVTVRRLHDTGRSGWRLNLVLIPLVGWIILIVLFCLPTKSADLPGNAPLSILTPSPSGEVRIPYGGGIVWPLLILLLCGGLCWFLGDLAWTNDRGLILNEIPLSRETATGVYWFASIVLGLAALSGFGLLLANVILRNREIVLSMDAMTAPAHIFASKAKTVTIQFATMHDITITRSKHGASATLSHASGKLQISSSLLPSKKHFEDMVAILTERAGSARSAP